MNEHLDHNDVMARSERELTLSTGAILGIFFGLVVLCGLCFGVGYNMGRKSTPTPLAINDSNSDSTAPDSASTAKPSAGSPFEAATPAATESAPVVVAPAPKPATVKKPAPAEPAAATSTEATTAPPPARDADKPAAPIVRAVPPSALMPGVAASGPGSVMVQVAAVSHQEDADLLVGALRSRGYAVTAHPASSDGFIHVQIGPFSDKKTAEAMKQRLLSDGYNAILK